MNKFCFFIVLILVFLFGCNTNKEKDFVGYWVIKGDTDKRKIQLTLIKAPPEYPDHYRGAINFKSIYWHIKDGFFFLGYEPLKIISVSKETLKFTKLEGTEERPVGAEEVWIRVP